MAAVSSARRSELGDALRACRSAFIGVGIMSCMINLLYLTGSIFMLEVYDRVLPSRSVPTLVGLAILAGGLYIAQGVRDLIRGRILVPLTIVTEFMSRVPAREAMGLAARRNDLAATSRRNAEVLVAMGMSGRLTRRWSEANEKYLAGNQRASDVAGGLGAIAKVMRMTLQSAVLAVGAYLVIHQEATAGIIIAGSILSARALAPVDLAIAHWKGFVAARQGWHRLNRLLVSLPAQSTPTQLQDPSTRLSVEGVSIVPPGDQKVIVQEVTIALEAGSGLGVIGPSGSGKSSLVRALVGVWQPVRGKVRLDGAALD